MRAMMAAMAAGAVLAGCSGDSSGDNATAGNAAGYVPPSVTSRADYGGQIERRFRRLDTDNSGRLSATEVPPRRGQWMIEHFDRNGDGELDAPEWSEGMLARFDRQDANKDGSVTNEERQAARGRQDRLPPAQQAENVQVEDF